MHGHVYSRGIFWKKANHYDNFDCYTLGTAKPVIGTSENVAEPDYDVIKMATILKFNTNPFCFIMTIIVGRFQILGIKMFKMISAVYSHLEKMADLNNDVNERADILYLNENIHCIILLLIRVILKTDKSICFM